MVHIGILQQALGDTRWPSVQFIEFILDQANSLDILCWTESEWSYFSNLNIEQNNQEQKDVIQPWVNIDVINSFIWLETLLLQNWFIYLIVLRWLVMQSSKIGIDEYYSLGIMQKEVILRLLFV